MSAVSCAETERAAVRARHSSIRAFYRSNAKEIMESACEWGLDPYAWDCGIGIALTPIEAALWIDIRAENVVMYPQYPIGPFFADFANPAAKVAIECDGERWHRDAAKDATRQRAIEAMGWKVYRITGRDCFTDSTESEDEYGNLVFTSSTSRRFIQSICDRHDIRRSIRPAGMTSLRDAVVGGLDRLIARFA